MLMWILAEAAAAADHPATWIVIAGGVNATLLGWIIKLQRDNSNKIDHMARRYDGKIEQMYSHVADRYAKRETVEIELRGLKETAMQTNKLIEAFINSQNKMSNQLGSTTAMVEMIRGGK